MSFHRITSRLTKCAEKVQKMLPSSGEEDQLIPAFKSDSNRLEHRDIAAGSRGTGDAAAPPKKQTKNPILIQNIYFRAKILFPNSSALGLYKSCIFINQASQL